MKINRESRRCAKVLFKACMVDSMLDENRVGELIEMLIEKKPRRYFEILKALKKLIENEVKERTLTITTAIDLLPEEKEKLVAVFENKYGKLLEVKHKIDSQLLGGLKIQKGSDVRDGTVRSRLNQFMEEYSLS